jgi:putative NADH-flavin reductase
MKIAVIGATGMIGSRVVAEALARGHDVIALVRKPESVPVHDRVTALACDATEADSVARGIAGADVVVDAFGPGSDQPQDSLSANARAVLAAMRQSGVSRAIIVGGAGSLEVAPGVMLADSPNFPEAVRPRANAQRAQRDIIRGEAGPDLIWTFISPSALIAPGERTARFRVGGPQLLVDANGKSHISAEDYAVALLDEIERPQHMNEQITVGY